MDFDQTCTYILLGHVKEVLDFGDYDPIFKVTWRLRLLENGLSAPYLLNEWILTKLVHLYCWDIEKNWLDFGDLDPIFKVILWLRLLENGLSAHCHLKEWVDFDQTCTVPQLYCWDMQKNWLYFCDLDLIFKVTRGLWLLENGFSPPYILKEWMDFDQTCTSVLWHGKELIRFWWLLPDFQGHRRAQIGKWLVYTLYPEWIGGFWPNLHSYIVETGTKTD